MDFFEDIDFENLGEGEDKNEDEDPADKLQTEVRKKLAKQREAAAAATEAENEETKPIGAGAYLAKMAAKTAKDKEESAAKELVRTALKKKNEKISIEPVVGDRPLPMQRQQTASGPNGKGGSMLEAILPLVAKAGMAYLTGGASAAVVKEGGQIASKIKTKAKPKAKKRYVRGVGAAKRGYGKATYSKKMY
jgi:hypothetical protein